VKDCGELRADACWKSAPSDENHFSARAREQESSGGSPAHGKIQDVMRMVSRLKDTRTPAAVLRRAYRKEWSRGRDSFRGPLAPSFMRGGLRARWCPRHGKRTLRHEKGAFTGALNRSPVCFMRNGERFSSMNRRMRGAQAKLLRVLQEKKCGLWAAHEKIR